MQADTLPSELGGKRKRNEEGTDTESDDGNDGNTSADVLTEITDERTLDALTELTCHSSRFDVDTIKLEVIQVLQWHLSNTSKSSRLNFDTYYQRDQTAGWTEEQESQYIKSVMAGRASTPFVANTKRASARLMDGGHRLQALLKFYKNELPIKIGDQKVFYKQVHPFFADLHLCACTVPSRA